MGGLGPIFVPEHTQQVQKMVPEKFHDGSLCS